MLAALCDGGGSSADLALLRSGQLSKRMLQLRAIIDASESRAAEAGELARVAESYQSLVTVQQNQPQIVAELLASPQVGAWALSFPLFIDGAKEAAEGSLMALSFVAEPTNERRATFLARYARKFEGPRIPVPMAAALFKMSAMFEVMIAPLASVQDGFQ